MKMFLFLLMFATSVFASQSPVGDLPTTGTPTGLQIVNETNTDLKAVATFQSGTADPTTNGGAYSWWADTTSNFMKQRNSANTGWISLFPLNNGLLPLAGGVLTGNLTTPGVLVSGSTATDRAIAFQTSGLNRWIVEADAASESGSNNGSNFLLMRYSDSGSYLGLPFYCIRSNGICGFETAPNFPTPSASTADNTAATTKFVVDREKSKCRFMAHANANQTTQFLQIVVFQSVDFNQGGCYDGTAIFTANENGYYQFNYSIYIQNLSGAAAAIGGGFSSSGVMYAYSGDNQFTNGRQQTFSGSSLVKMSAGQALVVTLQSPGLTANWPVLGCFGQCFSWFSGHFVGAY